ncbi:metallophosphoesterase [Dyadobacter sp. CY323]|uniref:metallophosphoesterase n=1 Tax=Dyadobacter sp. CY323 TaxID=2907302 RepID=UPI001F375F23|nr:metallophosphoesterase [Dyadobacter sp. CY323]MCE6991031.1 metallophosphoesterase [Dyadobacter sp. CY323]
MKKFLLPLFFLVFASVCFAQEDIVQRVIFIGDAGEMNDEQRQALKMAGNLVIQNKTNVMFLGDNIYPRGIGLPGEENARSTEQILKSQFEPLRATGAPVYFTPGNHDWNNSNGNGLKKIRRAGEFLNEQNDPDLKMVPANGCPDPIEIALGDSMTIIAYDSQWWLLKTVNPEDYKDCACKTKDEVVARMQELKFKNQGKYILLTSHHPFQSYGPHGSRFRVKDYIFPLTNWKEWLYLPTPLLGLTYVILRPIVLNQDIRHRMYQDLIGAIEKVFEGTSHVVFVAGHEHGLQFIKNEHLQIVSGAGAKRTYAKKGKKGSLFSESRQGFVTVDLKSNRNLQISFYLHKPDHVEMATSWSLDYADNLVKVTVP